MQDKTATSDEKEIKMILNHENSFKPYMLALETTGKTCSVAIFDDLHCLKSNFIRTEKYAHTENLHQLIQQTLEECTLTLQNIRVIAISRGPGSYTGLRIGMSAAKGLCYALKIPLIEICTLNLAVSQGFYDANNLSIKPDYWISLLDARNAQAYVCIYNKEKIPLIEVQKIVLNTDFFAPYLQNLPDGKIPKIAILSDSMTHRIFFPDSEENNFKLLYPNAENMGILAFEKWRNGDTVPDLAHLNPLYF